MSDAKSTDHWKSLVAKLGATPSEEPERQEPAADQTPSAADAGLDEATGPAPEFDSSPLGAQLDTPAPLQSAPVQSAPVQSAPAQSAPAQVFSPAKHVQKPPERTTAVPKPKLAKHWYELANSLGLEVAEPEPEPEPEPVLEPEPKPDAGLETTPASAVGDARQALPPTDPPATAISTWITEPPERPSAARTSPRSQPRSEGRFSGLFEDPDLALDAPGVLDAVFDEVDAASSADREPEAQPDQPSSTIDSFGRGHPFMARERERVVAAQPQGETDDAISADETVASDAEHADRGRPNRRRRRRSTRRTSRPAAGPAPVGAVADDFGDDGNADDGNACAGAESLTDPRREIRDRPRRRTSAAVPTDEDQADEDQADDEDLFDDEDEREDGGDPEDGGERLRLKHKKIPTWAEAIEPILTANMETRTKNPGGDGGRGRTRRWRR